MSAYGIVSDTHHHLWSAFATTLESGVNSRLQMLLDETKRCAAEVRLAGGNTIVHAGDLFHVRGSVAPSVLNPTMDCYRDIIKSGTNIVILAGNHDLEGKDSNRIGSAITALEGVGCKVINSANYSVGELVMIPWHKDIDKLKTAIEAVAPEHRPHADLILHAPIDGVIKGLPDHGLTDTYLAGLGYRRVFSGHYHNHKDFGNGVYSIGALAHHTWGDIGSKAGFLVVPDGGAPVKWFKSHAPEFVDLDGDAATDDLELLVDGNFVRVKIASTSQKDVQELRTFLEKCGAKGVTILAQKASAVEARTGSTVSAGASMAVSVNDFIASKALPNTSQLAQLCQDILTETEAAS